MKSLNYSRWTVMARRLALWWMALALLAMAGVAQAQSQAVGTVTHLSGLLTARHADGTRTVLAVKSAILQGDTLITERGTYTRVQFLDDAEIVLRPGSEVVVAKYVYDEKKPENDSVAINLVKGGLRAVTGLVGKRNHEAVNFDTPTATIGIRGTNFGALFCQNDCGAVPTTNGTPPQNGLHVDVVQGAIVLTNPGGTQLFQAGQFGFTPSMQVPPIIVPVNPGIKFTPPPSFSTPVSPSQQSTSGQAVDCVVR
jgi:hypothetical protein